MSCGRARAASSWAAIGVVIPARDEAERIEACLQSVQRALAAVEIPSDVVVVAHHCTDATEELAREALRGAGTVITDDSPDVAGARRAGVARILKHFGDVEPRRLWLLSTDADTTVPPDWVHRILRHGRDGTTAVAGLADLDSWQDLPPSSRRAYRALIGAGIRGDEHVHAYAANLAVRADAYLDVDGWPAVYPGEEHALLAALEAAGWRVRRPVDVVVTTSGRTRARAAGGLGDLLAQL